MSRGIMSVYCCIYKIQTDNKAEYTKIPKIQKSACKSYGNMITYTSRENDIEKNISPTLFGVRTHPLVEHSAVNRVVVGSSPTRGAKKARKLMFTGFLCLHQQEENKKMSSLNCFMEV